MRLTDEQKKAIETTGANLLVSAAAGAGKTMVLVERFIHLVCEEASPVDVDRVLAVTFTEAAAAQMRERIAQGLRQRIGTSGSLRLRRQLVLLDKAAVSTIHSFCLEVVRQNFHCLGIDPAFSVMDPDEADLLKAEVMEVLFESWYERADEKGRTFQEMIKNYGGKGTDEALKASVIRAHDLLQSFDDPGERINLAREQYAEEISSTALKQSDWYKAWTKDLAEELEKTEKECNRVLNYLEQMGIHEYHDSVAKIVPEIEKWKEVLSRGDVDALAGQVRDYKSPSLKSAKNLDDSLRKSAQSIIKRFRERIKRDLAGKLLAFDLSGFAEGLEKVRPSALLFLDLVQEFREAFAAAKADLAGLDFSDLEQGCLLILKGEGSSDPGVTKELRKRYLHVLVDEYQDINPVQSKILDLISQGGETGRTENLFMVGDVKQSIYQFRLADPGVFRKKYDQYREGKGEQEQLIHLAQNFRSREGIVNAVNFIFRQIMSRETGGIDYDKEAELVYGADYPDLEEDDNRPAVEVHFLEKQLPSTTAQTWSPGSQAENHEESEKQEGPGLRTEDMEAAQREALFVAGKMKALRESGFLVKDEIEKKYRPVIWRDMVVLLRSTARKARVFAEIFQSSGIPVYSELSTGYFGSTEIQDILSLLEILDNPRQDIFLASVLRSPLVGLNESELVLIRAMDRRSDFYGALAAYRDKGEDKTLKEKVEKFLDRLDLWRESARRERLSELLWKLYRETNYLNYVRGLWNGIQRHANLIYLHDRARQFDHFTRQGLSRFLRFIRKLIEQGSDLGSAPTLSEAEDVVRIMSIHRSKGLEFPIVFVTDLAKNFNLEDVSRDVQINRGLGVGLRVVDLDLRVKYHSLVYLLAQRRLQKDQMEEEMRLFYVAMTRARERLILSATIDIASAFQQWAAAGLAEPDFSNARSMVDWLGPALARHPDGVTVMGMDAEDLPESGGSRFGLRVHDGEEIEEWEVPVPSLVKQGFDLEKVSRLEPMKISISPEGVGEEVIRKLKWNYPLIGASRVPGAMTVTEIKRHYDLFRESFERRGDGKMREFTLRPAFLSEEARALSSRERGIATHTVLEHLDLEGALDLEDIQSQVREMMEKKILVVARAGDVEVDSIARFFSSEIGKRVRRNPQAVMREVPFILGVPAVDVVRELGVEGEDEIIVQGIIDCLVEEEGGYLLIDYKTDDVSREEAQVRVMREYAIQIHYYRQAVERILEIPVKESFIYFLTPGLAFTS